MSAAGFFSAFDKTFSGAQVFYLFVMYKLYNNFKIFVISKYCIA